MLMIKYVSGEAKQFRSRKLENMGAVWKLFIFLAAMVEDDIKKLVK